MNYRKIFREAVSHLFSLGEPYLSKLPTLIEICEELKSGSKAFDPEKIFITYTLESNFRSQGLVLPISIFTKDSKVKEIHVYSVVDGSNIYRFKFDLNRLIEFLKKELTEKGNAIFDRNGTTRLLEATRDYFRLFWPLLKVSLISKEKIGQVAPSNSLFVRSLVEGIILIDYDYKEAA